MTFLRNYLWRLSRGCYLYLRGESTSLQAKNGEFSLLRKIISGIGCGNFVFMDIGANNGIWIDGILRFRSKMQKISIYGIEPSLIAHRNLVSKYNKYASIFRCAFDQGSGIGFLNIYGDVTGINSLYKFSDRDVLFHERVNLISFDEFCEQNDLQVITFVKSDTEGNCFNVIKGANNALQRGRILFWQFEYNYRWLYAGHSLLKVFDFIKDKNYFLGKICPKKIIIYQKWHFELDRFVESNFVLIRKDSMHILGDLVEFHGFNRFNVSQKIH